MGAAASGSGVLGGAAEGAGTEDDAAWGGTYLRGAVEEAKTWGQEAAGIDERGGDGERPR